jgi:hypothetical protein
MPLTSMISIVIYKDQSIFLCQDLFEEASMGAVQRMFQEQLGKGLNCTRLFILKRPVVN